MNKFIIVALLLIPVSLSAQWRYQLGFGRILGGKDAFSSTNLTDTLSYNFLKKGLNTTSASIMATYRFNEKLLIRTGIDGSKTTVDIWVENSQSNSDIYEERRSFAEFHFPAEVQYELSKGFFLNSGLSTNIRYERTRYPIEERVTLNQPFGDPLLVDEFEEVAYNSMRQASVNYRLGTTVKFLPWLGIDLMYDRPFASLVRSLKLEGDQAKPNFKYGIWTMRLTYFFEWEKLKASLSK
ncbi:MAG: hypothetical protein GY816_22465 [Cytophagales bacterium]|nr:hypothetical protein [Cytophagales bacterium]